VKAGEWQHSHSLRTLVQVIEVLGSLGFTGVRVWNPSSGDVSVLPESDLAPAPREDEGAYRISRAAAAAKIVDALASGMLVAPTQSVVEPLPHQLRALREALSRQPVRKLLADEVGLGKTIEAGLLMSELMLRGQANRVLVVAPKGLVPQWQSELQLRFGETFTALSAAEVSLLAARREDNFWLGFDRLIVSLDAVKPITSRRGWTDDEVDAYNAARSVNLAAAAWDLAIVDEAHRVAGYTDQVARHRMAVLLAESVPHLLLLTATPHVGKTDGFRRLVSLLDPLSFATEELLTPHRVRPFVVRTSKRVVIDAAGKPLFQPRSTTRIRVQWPPDQANQRRLYEEVSAYAADGYNAGRRTRDNPLIFLMLLMQRLASSSTVAITRALEKRLGVLAAEEHQRRRADPVNAEFWETEGDEQLELLLQADLPAITGERERVERLLELAASALAEGADAKLERLDQLLLDVARDENDPQVKVIVFTEFRATQAMITDHLCDLGHEVVILNGEQPIEERAHVQEEFAASARILVSTEAGGEGLNLQTAHLVVNYDLPWNPMRIEQRIGRVDRIGQTHPVRAFNLLLEGSVEDRVQSVLEAKLGTILDEFGVDKLGDVLDSAGWEGTFQELYSRAVTGESIEGAVDELAGEIRDSQMSLWDWRDKLGGEMPDPGEARALRDHPFPRWMETLVVADVLADGGEAQPDLEGWRLRSADALSRDVTFTRAQASTTRRFVTLGDEGARGALRRALSASVEGQPVPRISLDSSVGSVGCWSLWSVSAYAGSRTEQRTFALFHDSDGKLRLATANAIWDAAVNLPAGRSNDRSPQTVDWSGIHQDAEIHAGGVFSAVEQELAARLGQERDRFLTYIEARRRVFERIGLENVRRRRLAELETERAETVRRLADPHEITGELRCVAAAWIEA
jgi:superfamily II DNA or RNA helicase